MPLLNQYIANLADADIQSVVSTISEERLSTYLHCTQSNREALQLYALNTDFSKHVFELIGGFEISLRNAVSTSIAEHYGRGDWYRARRFTKVLTPERRTNIRDVRKRLTASNREERSGRIVAGLTFHFWVSMHEKRYRDVIWTPHLHRVWLKGENLKHVQKDLFKIRDLRNRIAHFEPIFDEPWRDRINIVWTRFDQIAPVKSAWYRHRMHSKIEELRRECEGVRFVPG